MALIAERRRAAFGRMKQFCGVKTERARVAELRDGCAVIVAVKRMRGVVYELESMAARDVADDFVVAGAAEYVHRQYGRCGWRNERFDQFGIDGQIVANVAKYGRAAALGDRVHRGGERKGRGDNLACYAERIERRAKRERAARKKRYGRAHALRQRLLEPLVHDTAVCERAGMPDFKQLRVEPA
ncbi:hypothetical protein SDC9_132037 [bioreactor metagenome]|uniref:Uncharacterized protein n=1 Tax=bioreactor metagenome TaxID=1076179 RepID=A0A645D6S7_9ZZZZ